MKPVHFDGAIYVAIAFFGAVASSLSSDDAAKYIGPAILWIAKNSCTAIAAALLALKMFRSTAYSDWQKEKKDNGTQHLMKF